MYVRNFTKTISITLLLILCRVMVGLEPKEVLVVANKDIAASVRIAKYYISQRRIPSDNVFYVHLGKDLANSIGRDDYNIKLAVPLKYEIEKRQYVQPIRCIVTTFGVPYKVGKRGMKANGQKTLRQLEENILQAKLSLKTLEETVGKESKEAKNLRDVIELMQANIDLIQGKDTDASVDSELSMLMFGDYELWRWYPNRLNKNSAYSDLRTLMVSRLDGPTEDICKSLIDKSVKAEQKGLHGVVYVDSGYSKLKTGIAEYKQYDGSLNAFAANVEIRGKMKVVHEKTEQLFKPGSCPDAALYCGWYSLKHYIDSFDFADGAVGYHICSYEAQELRDTSSGQWCPNMLADGITATIGAVSEPYLTSFPKPDEFFSRLLDGYCLAEAYYQTKPFNSWKMILIGDPLYKPFGQQ